MKKICNQESSTAVIAKALYSASVEERGTVGCFLANQEIGFETRKTNNHMVQCMSVGSPAQSASEKAVRDKGPREKQMPWFKVPLRYLRTRLAASKWTEVGLLMNWQSWWTLKAEFGLAKVRYWRAPTTLLYIVGSDKRTQNEAPNKKMNNKESSQPLNFPYWTYVRHQRHT